MQHLRTVWSQFNRAPATRTLSIAPSDCSDFPRQQHSAAQLSQTRHSFSIFFNHSGCSRRKSAREDRPMIILGTGQPGPIQHGVGQVRPLQRCRTTQVVSAEIGIAQIRANEQHIAQICSAQISAFQVAAAQVSTLQHCPIELSTAETSESKTSLQSRCSKAGEVSAFISFGIGGSVHGCKVIPLIIQKFDTTFHVAAYFSYRRTHSGTSLGMSVPNAVRAPSVGTSIEIHCERDIIPPRSAWLPEQLLHPHRPRDRRNVPKPAPLPIYWINNLQE